MLDVGPSRKVDHYPGCPSLEPGDIDAPAGTVVRQWLPHAAVFPHAALLITQDFRDDKQRLSDLERKISEMEDVLLTQADLIGEAIAILSSAAEGAESEVRRAVWRRGRG